MSPGFRWGTSRLPGQDITIDDLYSQTSMNYPQVFEFNMLRQCIKILGLKDLSNIIIHHEISQKSLHSSSSDDSNFQLRI